tara:strand:+ start:70 stop:213 length:144 start_codon:yes stop_codon:yes gene_type:complete
MDKFFEKLFAKIADFHQRETELSQSLVDNKENLPIGCLKKIKNMIFI